MYSTNHGYSPIPPDQQNSAEKAEPLDIMCKTLDSIIGNNMHISNHVILNGSVIESTEFIGNANFRQIKISSNSETITISWQSNKPSSSTKPISEMGETIMRLRAEGKTQREIAEIFGTTQANISKIERNFKEQDNRAQYPQSVIDTPIN